MNTQFENRYLSTDKMLSEYVYKVIYRKIRPISIILFVSESMVLLFSLYLNRISDVWVFTLLISMLFVFLAAFLCPLLTIREAKESSKRINNGKDYETVVKFGDNISLTEGAFSLTIEYSQVLKIYNLKYSYLLMFGKNNAIIISPKHFTIGTFEDFKVFINQKVNLTK